MDKADLERLFGALAAEGVEYVLVGGMAMNLHGLPRFTEDVDIVVKLEAANVERLRRALRSIYDDPTIDEINLEDLAGDYPVIRYLPPASGPAIYIIGRLGERISFDDLVVTEGKVGAAAVNLASPASLHAMKADPVRPIDAQDAERLQRTFDIGRES